MANTKVQLPVSIEDVLSRYESGEEIVVIAKSLSVSERTLYRRLLDAEADWKKAQQANAVARFERAKDGHRITISRLEELRQQLDEEGVIDPAERNWRLAHARALEQAAEKALCRAEWELERLVDRLYGKESAAVTVPVQINIGISRESQITIESKHLDGAAQDK